VSRSNRPTNLWLYEQAVQHPVAEATLLAKLARSARRGEPAERFREDFAGTAAIAAAWVRLAPEHQALGVERHGPTHRWSVRRHAELLEDRPGDLLLVEADVHAVASPKVDLVAALNFSVMELHDHAALVGYLRHARRSLRPGGVVVVDLFGGPGAMRASTQRREVEVDEAGPVERFGYRWVQHGWEAATGRVRCWIDFDLPGGAERRRAFRYDWRLWSPADVVEAMRAAGLGEATIWSDRYDARAGVSDGRYRPARQVGVREDFLAYVVGRRR